MRKPPVTLLLVASTLAVSCGPTDPGTTHSILLASIGLVIGQDADGRLVGIDLDRRVDDDATVPESCFSQDGVAPDGTPGIDNKFSQIAVFAAMAVGVDVNALFQGGINEGRLLILAELSDVQSLENDPHVRVQMHFGIGRPDLGTDGFAEPWQSFDIDETRRSVWAEEAAIENGRLTVRGFDMDIVAYAAQSSFRVPLRSAVLQVDFDDAGNADGAFGGVLPADEVRPMIEDAAVGIVLPSDLDPLLDLVDLLLPRLIDISAHDDGVCDGISVGFTVVGRPAFVLRD